MLASFMKHSAHYVGYITALPDICGQFISAEVEVAVT